MRLNGVFAPEGTLLGIFPNFVTVVSNDYRGVEVRKATVDEMSTRRTEAPNSITEHRMIPRRMSPYGLIRQFNQPAAVPTQTKIEIPVDPRSRMERRGDKVRRKMNSQGWELT